MARVGTPVDGAVEERAECGKWSGIGRMVQRGQGALAGMASGMVMDGNGDGAKSETPSLWNFLILFYYEGPLPNQGEEVVLPWGVPPYIMWVGGEYKSFSFNISGNSPEGRDPSPGSRLAVEAQRLEWRYKCEPTKVVVFVPCKELRNSTVQY